MVKIAIAGGNIAGSTVMSMLRGDPDIEIVGIYEKDGETPGAVLAGKWGIPLYDDINLLAAKAGPEMIINVTNDSKLSETLRMLFSRIEVIDASGARFLWKTIEKQKKALIELRRAMEDQKRILAIAESAVAAETVGEFIGGILERALEINDSKAGSIVAVEGEEVRLLASKGLSTRFTENKRWKVMRGGLTDRVIRKKEMLAIPDISKIDFANTPSLIREGIRAMLVSPVTVGGRINGIMFFDDFKPRQYSERQKRAIGLVVKILGLVLDRQRLARNLGEREEELFRLRERFEGKVKERTGELEKMNRELERASQHKSRFIANMSHELRTPLNSILGFSEVLLEKTFGNLTENQERYLGNIRTSGKHLLELINNVLDIAKIEAGKYEMSYETFRIEDMISEVFSVMKPLADKKAVELRLGMRGDLDSVTFDPMKLKQVFYNLISNAIKFTPEGGKVSVVIDRERAGDASENQEYARFSVSDTGVGIRTEDFDRIFDEFEQADSAFSRQYGGAGLGLALTKKLVELHGGRITVESRLGQGSTFTVFLPLMAPLREEPAGEVEAVSLDFPWMDEKAPLILVVEDDPASAELLTIHLTQAGYKVAHAFDGEDAVAKASSLRPFAILLDIMLPKKDGWEVLQSFKSNETTSHIPVLIHSIVDNKDLAFALGATDYLMKPLDQEVLLEKLNGLSMATSTKHPATILIIALNGETGLLKESLDPARFLIYTAKEGRRGLELASALRPDLVLLDFELPDMLGFDVVKELKESPSTKNIPIFILTEKDIPVEERMNLMGKIERIIRKHKFDVKELIDHIIEIEVLYPKRAGLVDQLTGIFNHRYFQLRLAQEVERAQRYKQPLNLLLLDMDFFGQYIGNNDERAGDVALKKVAELLAKNVRGSDVVVRYGGDAFAVILPNTVLSAALSLGNRFNAIIRNYPFSCEETQPKRRLTASVGLAFLDGQTPEELIARCERALAQAIEKGGDRVEIYAEEKQEQSKVSSGAQDGAD
ncbi:MAG: diguanylate cyclase [Nitrospirae bacterium]|nr:diguanylate cyclase [Nitrospirota bacterium]